MRRAILNRGVQLVDECEVYWIGVRCGSIILKNAELRRMREMRGSRHNQRPNEVWRNGAKGNEKGKTQRN